MGALTSKPYAFTARPWELRKTESIDVHDAVGANIRIDSRGNEVMRILPRLNESVNEEWIADKSRFAYDGLKRARLDRPYVRDANTGELRAAGWDEALKIVADKIRATPPNRVAAMVGALCEGESIFALKELMISLGVKNLDCRTDGTLYDPSERCGYLMNSTIAGIDQADVILLIGTNPRWEAPLVNARIRKNILSRRIKVGVVGDQVDLTYKTQYIGAGLDSLSHDHSFFELLKNAQKPMVIIGQSVFLTPQGEAVHALLHDFAQAHHIVRQDWNGFNVLQIAASRVGALDLGFVPQQAGLNAYEILAASQKDELDVLYLMGVDEFNVAASVGEKTFVIYQGHHGDQGAARADVILPGAAYTEKDGLFVNTEGRVQMARRAVFPPGEAREDWKIIRAISDYAGKPLGYDTIFQLRQKLYAAHPHFAKVNDIKHSPWEPFGKKGDWGHAPSAPTLVPIIDNYYMTDSISRNSPTMAACTLEFVENPKNNSLRKQG